MPIVKIIFTPPTLSQSRDWQCVLKRFQDTAGKAVVKAVQGELGQSGLYTLTPAYSAAKQRNPAFRRVPNTAPDQPLILSGKMMEGLNSTRTTEGFVVTEKDNAGIGQDGFDYFQKWEDATDFFGQGFAKVESSLPDLFSQAVDLEMKL